MTLNAVEGITREQVEIVKSTVPVIQKHGEAITQAFYKLLFQENPGLTAVFDMERQASGEQPRALAAAILAYAGNVDRLDNLGPAMTKIAARHCRLGVAPEHYPVVGDVLLRSIRNVLGEAATPPIIDAWASAYGRLARVMTAFEEEIYASSSQCS